MQHHSPNSSAKFRKEIWPQTKMIKKWKRDCEFRERIKRKKHPPNFHKVQLSSQDPHEWRRSTFTEAALTCTQLETRSVSRVFSISRKQAAKSKSQQKKVIVKVPSYTKVIVIIIVAVFPGSKRRFFNPNRFFPVVARFLPPFSPHLTWFWVMKCDRLLAQQLGRITSSG